MSHRCLIVLALLAALPTINCQKAEDGGGAACADGKCDDPGSAAERECRAMCGDDVMSQCFADCRAARALDHCQARRDDAVSSGQRAFTGTAIRWACSDVDGVNTNGRDDRGQEYCEYFAIVAPPPETEGGAAPAPVELGRPLPDNGTGPLAVALTDDQIFALEDSPDTLVGQCVFRSWHADIEGELPICDGSAVTCPELAFADGARLAPWIQTAGLGFKMTQNLLRMTIGFNSNAAAADLVDKCLREPLVGDPANPDDPLNDDYLRGCMKTFQLFATEWRRSDPTICAGAARAAECGCTVDSDGDGVGDVTDPVAIAAAIVPPQSSTGEVPLRGFALGTWSSETGLPAGCRHLDTGDDSRTVVACDLTAADLLSSATDVKAKCREKYGDNVVVHIPIPAAALICNPPADGAYSSTCGEMVPWTAPDNATP